MAGKNSEIEVQQKYKNKTKHLGNVLVAAFFLMISGVSLAQNTHSASAVSGYVTVTSSDGSTRRVNVGDEFQDGDIIATGEGSSATIVLADGTVINLDESSTYKIGGDSSGGDDDDVGGGGGYGDGDTTPPGSATSKSPTLSTATSAGGGISDGPVGGSPTE